jgi:hypothetical protein
MNKDLIISIIKFMNQMDMTLSVDVIKSYRNHNGRKSVCVRVVVIRKEKKEYDSIHCYELNNGKISYSEGNRSMGVGDGILAYLGDNREVENYLEGLARYEAKNLFF